MGKWTYSAIFLCLFFAGTVFSADDRELQLEEFYFQTILNIQTQDLAGLNLQLVSLKECIEDCDRRRAVYVSAFEEYAIDQSDFLLTFWIQSELEIFGLPELVRIQSVIYQASNKKEVNVEPLIILNKKVRSSEDEEAFSKTVCAYRDVLPQIYSEMVDCRPIQFKPLSRREIKDLYTELPDIHKYGNGSYDGTFRMFMFCRQDRRYPCLFVLKDGNNKPVYESRRKLWSQPSLALSSRGLPYNKTNGQTPQGIYQLDSVMPAADQQLSFGKYRRIIVNFIRKSPNEQNHAYLLPKSHMSQLWWTQATEARDIGRALFRIHGTGKLNTDPKLSYFPFMPTSGCIAQRENTYNGIKFKDQRLLLDRLMDVLKLDVKFENEVQIKGLLYLVEIDNKKAAVTLDDLKDLGIK